MRSVFNFSVTAEKDRFDNVILLCIIAVGGILRFYGFSDIPLTHDELSAVLRLDFDTFRELIEYGVKEDGHPAGVQVFLYYWTKLFGTTEEAVKIPFLLMGLGSIPLAFFISRKWFNSTVALLVAAYMASLQYHLMYSQIARPYISGLFFCLLMVLFWTRLTYENGRGRIINAAGFILSAAFCSYNHHFSLLFAIIVGITGLFLIEKRKLNIYAGSLAAIVVLYIPHLPIFFYQLNRGGLDWLGEPRPPFFIEYIQYIFHFSPAVYLTVFVFFLAGIFLHRSGIWPLKRFQIISLVWFLLPVVIGYTYSRLVSPVIQYSVLIFSFPFLLFFLFSFYRPVSISFKILSVTVILVINISTLIWSREHYEVFYRQPVKQFALLTRDFLSDHDPGDVFILFNENPEYVDFYFSEINPGISYHSIFEREISPVEFRKWIASADTRYMIVGGLQREYISIIKEFYPALINKDFGFTYEYYIFSEDETSRNELTLEGILFREVLNYKNQNKYWKNTDHLIINDTDGQSFAVLDSIYQWGPRFEAKLTDIATTRYNFIDIGLEVKNVENNPGLIVCEMVRDGEQIAWRGSSISGYWNPQNRDTWQWAYLSLRLSGIYRQTSQMEDCMIRIYYWNRGVEVIRLRDFWIRVTEGNPRIYSLIEPLSFR